MECLQQIITHNEIYINLKSYFESHLSLITYGTSNLKAENNLSTLFWAVGM